MPNEISCAGFEDIAVLYAFGELSEGERAAVEAHVQACAECAAMLRSEIALHEAIAARTQAIVQPSDLPNTLLAWLNAGRMDSVGRDLLGSSRPPGTPWRRTCQGGTG